MDGNNTNARQAAAVREFLRGNEELVRQLVRYQDRFLGGLLGQSYLDEEMRRIQVVLGTGFVESMQDSFDEARSARDVMRRQDHERRTQDADIASAGLFSEASAALPPPSASAALPSAAAPPPSAAVDAAPTAPPPPPSAATVDAAPSAPPAASSKASGACYRCGTLGHYGFQCTAASAPQSGPLGALEINAADRSKKGPAGKTTSEPPKSKLPTLTKGAQTAAVKEGPKTRGQKRMLEDTKS